MPVADLVPRDRDGSFDPELVRNGAPGAPFPELLLMDGPQGRGGPLRAIHAADRDDKQPGK